MLDRSAFIWGLAAPLPPPEIQGVRLGSVVTNLEQREQRANALENKETIVVQKANDGDKPESLDQRPNLWIRAAGAQQESEGKALGGGRGGEAPAATSTDIDIFYTLKGDGYTIQAIRGYFTDQCPSLDSWWAHYKMQLRKQMCHFVVTEGGVELAPRVALENQFCRGKGRPLLELEPVHTRLTNQWKCDTMCPCT